ncbi:MAG: urease accessory protein UreF [Pseudomonadota bacterium]
MNTETALYSLLAWLSPSFPVGAYSYSHGLEYAVESGLVKDRDSLVEWVETIITAGSGRTDAMLCCAAYQAVKAEDAEQLIWVVERADALRGTAEMALESAAQGQAFLDTVRAAWAHAALEDWANRLQAMQRPPAYAVAVAVVAARHGLPLDMTLTAFLHAIVANLVSAGVRLIPLGQTDGQRAISGLAKTVIACVKDVLSQSLDDLGSATPMIDWTSMRHETQYTRLFRS